ncbi:MAG TPA: TIR domain-containing protein [Thermoanaerobaculia bacterium]|nr:TIR domain-containing protein [Thermoanaerobaculia bacterium]
MADIFISYSREDREKAAQLAHALEERHWTVWWDREIRLGLSFDEVIEREILASRCIIVLWTASSIGSKWVRREARAAARREVLVPIMAENVEPPLEFTDLQAADLAAWPRLDGHPEFEKVVQRIEELAPVADGAAASAGARAARADRSAAPPRPSSMTPGPSRTSLVRAVMAIVLIGAVGTGAVYLAMRRAASPDTRREGGASAPTTASLPPSESPKTSNATSSSSPARSETAAESKQTDFQLSIDRVNSFRSQEFEIANLDPAKDFSVLFKVKSTRPGGSTRYGIAWNFQPDDFMLFTLHSTSSGYYSIGPGRSRTYRPFGRFSDGPIGINAERDFDALQMSKSGDVLIFSINGREVWRTRDYPVLSNKFAFWVADTTDAVMSSYVVRQ